MRQPIDPRERRFIKEYDFLSIASKLPNKYG